MRYLSLFSGIEAASVAWENLGWTPVGFSEIDAFPCALLAARFPKVKNYGDVTKFKEWGIEPGSFDVLIGGSPCFVAGTLILTKRGLVPVEQVQVGDEVVTHRNRWQKVVRIGSKMAQTRLMRGQGHHGLVTTDEHPFYASAVGRKWNNDRRSYDRTFTDLDWVEAKDMEGKMWATPTAFPELPIPPITLMERETVAPEMTPKLMRIIGAWVGDGWVRDTPRPGRKNSCWGIVCLCAGFGEKTEQMRGWLNATGISYGESIERTTTRFTIHSQAFSRWLTENFGKYADGKTIPAWLLGATQEMRAAFLDGYLGTDGFLTDNGYGFSTVSKGLAFGISMLIHSTRRHAVTMYLNKPTRECRIEGRIVNERPSFIVKIATTSRSSVERDGFRLGLVRTSEPTGLTEEVFNIEVEGDNSYIADGICVHNCQAFSVAGLRKGLEDPRGNLTLTYLAAIEHFKPKWVIWENVPGVLSIDGGRVFGAFLGALEKLGFQWAYRVLDAQYVGGCHLHGNPFGRGPVPQRRRRIFVVASAGDQPHPRTVLFEPEGVRGDSAPRRKTRKGAAAPSDAGSTDGRGSGVTPIGLDEEQNAVIDGFGTLKARREGGGFEGVVYCADVTGTLCAGDFKGPGNTYVEEGKLIVTPQSVQQFVTQAEIAGPLDSHYFKGPGSRAGGEREYTAHITIDPTLAASNDPARVQTSNIQHFDVYNHRLTGDLAGIVREQHGTNMNAVFQPGMVVRRLTPTECERLQGFPDGWTLIRYRGKPSSDAPRYKALGNSMAVPVIRWLGQQIMKATNEKETEC